MRIYACSILAFSSYVSADGDGHVYQHMPALVPAEDMDQLKEAVRDYAFKMLPPCEGWTNHQLVAMVVTRQFYDAADTALKSGALNWEPEETKVLEL